MAVPVILPGQSTPTVIAGIPAVGVHCCECPEKEKTCCDWDVDGITGPGPPDILYLDWSNACGSSPGWSANLQISAPLCANGTNCGYGWQWNVTYACPPECGSGGQPSFGLVIALCCCPEDPDATNGWLLLAQCPSGPVERHIFLNVENCTVGQFKLTGQIELDPCSTCDPHIVSVVIDETA